MLLPSISTVSVSSSRQLQATALWNGRFQVRVTGGAGVLALIQAQDHAVAVLRQLDSLKHHVRRIDRGKAHGFAGRAACHRQHRLVEEVGLPHRARLLPAFAVREEGVGEVVDFLVGDGVRLNAGFNQRQGQAAILAGMAVLAVVEQADAVVAFRDIGPFLAAALEPGAIPARVLVGLAGQVAELDIKGGLVGVDIGREEDLEQVLMLMPIHGGDKVDAAGILIEMDILADLGMAEAALDVKRRAHRAGLGSS